MRSWSVRQLFLVLLGVLAALGINLSVVAASGMSTSMTKVQVVSSSMAAMDCQSAIQSDGCKKEMASCGLVCAGPVLVVPPLAGLTSNGALGRDAFAPDIKVLVGTSHPPNLSPPRTTDIG